MPNFFENLIAHSLAGGLRGSIEQFLAEEYAKKKAIAEAWGQGKGVIPSEALPSFLRAGWGMGGQSPDIPTQLSPLSRSGEPDYRPGPMRSGYASIESPTVRTEREFGQGVEAQFSDPASQMYRYLQKSGRSAAEARQMTLSVFGEDLPEGHWLLEEPTTKEMLAEEEAKTELGRKRGIEQVLPGVIGAYGKERFVEEVGKPQLGRPLLEQLGVVPEREAVKAPRVEKDPMIEINRQLETVGKIRNAVYRTLPTKTELDPSDPTVRIKVPDLSRATPKQKNDLARADSLEVGATRRIDELKGYKIGQEKPSKVLGPEQPEEIVNEENTSKLITNYQNMLTSGTQSKNTLLKDLEDSAEYYRQNGIDIERVKTELGL